MKILGALLQVVATVGLLIAALFTAFNGYCLLEARCQFRGATFAWSVLALILSWALLRIGIKLQARSPGGAFDRAYDRVTAAWSGARPWKRTLIAASVMVAAFYFFFGFLAWLMGINYSAAP